MKHISIRPAVISDMTAIHSLVKQLAHYEKAPEEVITTPEIYARDFANGIFECLVAVQEDNIIGIALFFIAYSTWKGKIYYLDDLVVRGEFRGQGIGKKLFDALLRHAKDNGVKRVKWQVLDWNTPAIRFYEKYHALFDKAWWNGWVDLPT